MAVIRYTKDENIRYAYLNIFPDQFKTEEEKQDDSWVKSTMDYFSNKAYSEYTKNRDTFVKNYDLVKGILRSEDFYQEPETRSFMDTITADIGLPKYVKHYSIMTTPLNELVGEISKRPDEYRVKAFDQDSKSEELEYKTEILNNYIVSQAKKKILEKAAIEGQEIDEEDLQALTMEQVKDEIDTYTSIAEKWGNHILTALKAEFNLKEKSEEAFRDLSISAREYFHVYEDNSKLGFNVSVINPKNTWFLTTPDKKYISDVTGRNQGAYAAGTVEVLEISEIIDSCPDLTKDEIDHLRKALQDYGLINVRESNLFNGVKSGVESVTYDTYDPLVLQTRMMIEGQMKENNDSLVDFLGLSSNVSSFGYKYVVVTAYWISKKKIGKLTYTDEMDNIQTVFVDEDYVSGTIPTQLDLEWGWMNQWYQGKKIGPDIYHIKPFRLLPYCPVIGINYEIKNTEAKSLIDMMKPFQVLYNICMNQLYQLLEKEIGNVASINIRRIPIPKDGDAQDAIEAWEMDARQKGIIFDDDSPENTKAPVSNQTVAKQVDLTRTNEIQSRYNLAIQLKNECWELIGMSKQRLGSVTASESATGTNAALTQSYNQTEPMFVTHEYVLGQLYQALIDAAQYIESQKPESTISYITTQGESAFIQVNGSDIRLRDIKVFPTNRPEDKKMFEEIRLLAQPLMQNGGSLYDVIELFSTNSVRQMKKVFKSLKDRMEEMQNVGMQQKQQEIQQKQDAVEQQLAQAAALHEEDMINENYQNELDRINKREIAIITATGFGKVEAEDSNNNDVFDVLESGKLSLEREKVYKDHDLKLADINSKNKQSSDKMALELEKIKVERENMKNDKEIAIIQARSKAKEKKAAAKKKKK